MDSLLGEKKNECVVFLLCAQRRKEVISAGSRK